MRKWLKSVLIGATAVVVVAIASLLFLFYLMLGDSGEYVQRPYEKQEWLHGTSRTQMRFPRLGMADYLIEHRMLHGLGKREVIEMLGATDGEDIQWSEKDNFDLLYWLGPERGFMSVDSEWLAIKFDGSGKVAEYKLVRD